MDAGAHGVRVNLVSPGAVDGPRLDAVLAAQAAAQGVSVAEAREVFASGAALRRTTPSEDVAAAVTWLLSDAAASTTGEDLNVSAGLVMH